MVSCPSKDVPLSAKLSAYSRSCVSYIYPEVVLREALQRCCSTQRGRKAVPEHFPPSGFAGRDCSERSRATDYKQSQKLPPEAFHITSKPTIAVLEDGAKTVNPAFFPDNILGRLQLRQRSHLVQCTKWDSIFHPISITIQLFLVNRWRRIRFTIHRRLYWLALSGESERLDPIEDRETKKEQRWYSRA